MKKPWSLDRRSFLKGSGVACLLPYLEAMGPVAPSVEAPRRACFVYFPNGCSLPDISDERNARWRWFPEGRGDEFRFTSVLEPLEPFRSELAIYGGLSHPKSRELLGHLAGDTWLTSGDLRFGEYQNSISVDQVAARALGSKTRYPSLAFSSDGGVGYKSRISTLSFDSRGRPIPSEHQPRRIFERYFAPDGGATTEARRRALREDQKVVDLMREESRRLERVLGRQDRQKLEEFLESIRDLETRIQRSEAWLATPVGDFDASHIDRDVNPSVDPAAYIRTMYDLMVLGYQLDLTRVMTYMLAREDAMGIGEGWPRLAIGVHRGHHTISHDQHEGHWEQWGRYDRWMAEQFAYFLKRMKETSDEHGSLLDRTMVLYGSACSTTHNARNYPLALAGGRDLGLRLGHYTKFSRTAVLEAQNDRLTGGAVRDGRAMVGEDDLPCADLFLSMLHALGVEAESFADSEGPLDGFLR